MTHVKCWAFAPIGSLQPVTHWIPALVKKTDHFNVTMRGLSNHLPGHFRHLPFLYILHSLSPRCICEINLFLPGYIQIHAQRIGRDPNWSLFQSSNHTAWFLNAAKSFFCRQTKQHKGQTEFLPHSPPGAPLQSQAFSWWTSCFLPTLRLELPLKVCQQFSIPEAGRSAGSSRINTVFFVHSGQSWRCQAPRGDLEEGHMNGDTPQCYLCALSRVDSSTHNSSLQTNFPWPN